MKCTCPIKLLPHGHFDMGFTRFTINARYKMFVIKYVEHKSHSLFVKQEVRNKKAKMF